MDETGAAAWLPERVESDRLVVRLWELGDAEALHDAITASIEHLRPWMAWIGLEPLTVTDRRALIAQWLDEWHAGGDAVYGIFTTAGDVVGGSGLHQRLGPNGLEIGYWIHAHHARRGYATESSGALTAAALALPPIDTVEIHHDEANVASAGVPRALGYERIATREREPEAPGDTGVVWVWRTTDAALRSQPT